MGKKRLYRSLLGIPIWLISGLSLFVLFSAIYDWFVRDVSAIRYGLIISTSLILFITIVLHLTSIPFIAKQTRRQLGG